MKVNQTKNQNPQTSLASQAESQRRAERAGNSPDEGAAKIGTRRDFASVLEDVSQARERADGLYVEDSKDAGAPERGPFDEKTRRRKEALDEHSQSVCLDLRGGARQVESSPEAIGPASLLPVADLEKIVAAIRTHINAGGHSEITLELSRSVLAGLRVRLSADSVGRITAEFIAATEHVRALLDAHAQELADRLRSQGVDLSTLRTTLEAGSSGQQNDDRGQGHAAPFDFERAAAAPIHASGTSAEETTAAVENKGESHPTTQYRA